MTTHRISELDLTVARTRSAPDRPSAAQEFVTNVIDRAGNELERRFPGRIFVLRTLDLRFYVRAHELTSPGAIDRYAEEIAATLATLPNGETQSPELGDVFVFRDRAEQWAAYIRVYAAGRSDALWPFATITSSLEPIRRLVSRGDSKLTIAVLRILADEDLLPVARLLESETIAREIALQAGLRLAPSNSTTGAGELLALDEVARRLRLIGVPAAPISRLVLAFAALLTRRAGLPPAVDVRDSAARLSAMIASPAAEARTGPESGTGAERSETLHEPAMYTGWAGLFYVMNIMVELNAGEILWKACVDERIFVREMLLAICGVDDAAIDQLSGAPRDAVIAASREQFDEIVAQFPAGGGWFAGAGIGVALANSVLSRFVERVQFDAAPTLDELRSMLAIRAQLFITDDELHALLPLEAIDIRIRRAGLDRDPGWIPWIKKSVRIVFNDQGAAF